jgi:hypothetical protein
MAVLLLPTAAAAASPAVDPSGDTDPEEDPEPIAFAPRADLFNAGGLGNETVQVHFAWAEGYTLTAFGTPRVDSTTGAKAPFSYTFTSTNTSDVEVTSSGTSDGSYTFLSQSTKPGTTAVLRLTSIDVPSDVREFTRLR